MSVNYRVSVEKPENRTMVRFRLTELLVVLKRKLTLKKLI